MKQEKHFISLKLSSFQSKALQLIEDRDSIDYTNQIRRAIGEYIEKELLNSDKYKKVIK